MMGKGVCKFCTCRLDNLGWMTCCCTFKIVVEVVLGSDTYKMKDIMIPICIETQSPSDIALRYRYAVLGILHELNS